MRKYKFCIISLLVLILIATGCENTPFSSDPDEIILSISPPSDFDDEVLRDFEQIYDNVTIVIGSQTEGPLSGSITNNSLEEHLDATEEYMSSADVVYVTSENFSLESVRAGYYLNLTPLINADTDLVESDFYRNSWDSFSFDNNKWAIPVGITLLSAVYNSELFSAESISVPPTGWTIYSLNTAVKKTSYINLETGNVYIPGFSFGDKEASVLLQLYYNMTGGYFDLFNDLDNQKMSEILEVWFELKTDNYVSASDMIETELLSDQDKSKSQFAMRIIVTKFIDFVAQSEAVNLDVAGFNTLRVYGYAVNPTTEHAELSYELAKFIATSTSGIASNLNGINYDVAAFTEISLEDTEIGKQYANSNLPDIKLAIEGSLANNNEIYGHYLIRVLTLMQDQNMPAEQALLQVQAEARDNLIVAEARRETTILSLPTPQPTLGPDETVLRVGGMEQLLDVSSAIYDSVASDFVADDPEIGRIDRISFENGYDTLFEDADCFYLPGAALLDASRVISIEPFIADDAAYNTTTLLPGIADAVTIDGQMRAMPLVVYPTVIVYDTENLDIQKRELIASNRFDDFVVLLQQLQTDSEGAEATFVAEAASPVPYFMLAAADGTIVYDIRTSPPTLDLTSENAVASLRRGLDLARENTILYDTIEIALRQPSQQTATVIAAIWNDFIFRNTLTQNDYAQLLPTEFMLSGYPAGVYTPIAYGVGAGYINATSAHTDACYRWFRHVALNAASASAMPALASLVDDPAIASNQGEVIAAFYQEFASAMNRSNTVRFPARPSAFEQNTIVELAIIGRAFNAYVEQDALLPESLAAAQQQVENYRSCRQSALDENGLISTDDEQNCIANLDESIAALFPQQ